MPFERDKNILNTIPLTLAPKYYLLLTNIEFMLS